MIGFLDSQIVEKFKKFQKQIEKYSDLIIEEVEFIKAYPFNDEDNVILIGSKKIANHEELNQIIDINGLPVYDASSNINTYVDENKFSNEVFEVEDNNNPDISFASEGNSSAGTNFIIHQDKYFVNNHRTVVKFTKKYYSKYVYYNIFKMKEKFGFKRGYTPSQRELMRLQIMIPIPNDVNEKYKSFDIQKIIVEFLEFWKLNYTDIFRKKIFVMQPILATMKKNLVSSTFKLDKKIVESFDNFAKKHTNPLRLEQVPFKHCVLGEIIELHGGDRITKKKDSGILYPVYGGGGESFRTDKYNRENEYVIGRFAISKECVRFVNRKFHLLDSGFTFKIKNEFDATIDKDYVGYFLLSSQDNIYGCANGQAQKNLDTNLFYKIPFFFPEDKNLQILLVEFWATIINKISKKEKLFENTLDICNKVDEAFLYKTFNNIIWSK